jgi:hypothetical protein
LLLLLVLFAGQGAGLGTSTGQGSGVQGTGVSGGTGGGLGIGGGGTLGRAGPGSRWVLGVDHGVLCRCSAVVQASVLVEHTMDLVECMLLGWIRFSFAA